MHVPVYKAQSPSDINVEDFTDTPAPGTPVVPMPLVDCCKSSNSLDNFHLSHFY